MRIRVKLFDAFKRFAPGDAADFTMSQPSDASVEQLLSDLGVPATLPRILLVNGRRSDPATPLRDGDTVVIFPPVSGG